VSTQIDSQDGVPCSRFVLKPCSILKSAVSAAWPIPVCRLMHGLARLFWARLGGIWPQQTQSSTKKTHSPVFMPKPGSPVVQLTLLSRAGLGYVTYRVSHAPLMTATERGSMRRSSFGHEVHGSTVAGALSAMQWAISRALERSSGRNALEQSYPRLAVRSNERRSPFAGRWPSISTSEKSRCRQAFLPDTRAPPP
jgi:hypothetical protein